MSCLILSALPVPNRQAIVVPRARRSVNPANVPWLNDLAARLRRPTFAAAAGYRPGAARNHSQLRNIITIKLLIQVTDAWPFQARFDFATPAVVPRKNATSTAASRRHPGGGDVHDGPYSRIHRPSSPQLPLRPRHHCQPGNGRTLLRGDCPCGPSGSRREGKAALCSHAARIGLSARGGSVCREAGPSKRDPAAAAYLGPARRGQARAAEVTTSAH